MFLSLVKPLLYLVMTFIPSTVNFSLLSNPSFHLQRTNVGQEAPFKPNDNRQLTAQKSPHPAHSTSYFLPPQIASLDTPIDIRSRATFLKSLQSHNSSSAVAPSLYVSTELLGGSCISFVIPSSLVLGSASFQVVRTSALPPIGCACGKAPNSSIFLVQAFSLHNSMPSCEQLK